MKCTLKQTPNGYKLIDRTTGRLYGYVRGEGSTARSQQESERALLARIKEEIDRNGCYDTDKRS